MYCEPQVKATPRPESMEQAVALAEDWTKDNEDFVDQNSTDLSLGLDNGVLSLQSKKDASTSFPVTRHAMLTLLRRVGLPQSLATLFDENRESASHPAEREAKTERCMEFVNGVFSDVPTNMTIRTREGHVRCVLPPSAMLLDYGDCLKKVSKTLDRLKWPIKEHTIKEFQLADDSLPLALTRRLDRSNPDDKLSVGVKAVFSESGEATNGFYSYLYRLVCTNGLIAPVESHWFPLSIRRLRQNFFQTIYDGVQAALNASDSLLERSAAMKQFRLKLNGRNRVEAITDAVNRVATSIRLPKPAQEIIVGAWASSGDRSLYGLQNALTAVAQQYRNEDRAALERSAGRLLFLAEPELKRIVIPPAVKPDSVVSV